MMFILIGGICLIASIIFFLVDRYDEHSAIITQLSRNKGYAKLQTSLIVLFLVLTSWGIYNHFFKESAASIVNVQHEDHTHLVEGKIEKVAYVHDQIIKTDEPFTTRWIFWNEVNPDKIEATAIHNETGEKAAFADWTPASNSEGAFFKDHFKANHVYKNTIILNQKGTWQITFKSNDKEIETVEVRVQ